MKRFKNIESKTKDQIKSQSKPIENDVDSVNKNEFKKLELLSDSSLKAKKEIMKLKS